MNTHIVELSVVDHQHRDPHFQHGWGVDSHIEAMQHAHNVMLALTRAAPASQSTCVFVVACSNHVHRQCRSLPALREVALAHCEACFQSLGRCVVTAASMVPDVDGSMDAAPLLRLHGATTQLACSGLEGLLKQLRSVNRRYQTCSVGCQSDTHRAQVAMAVRGVGGGVDAPCAGVCLLHAHWGAGGPHGVYRGPTCGERGPCRGTRGRGILRVRLHDTISHLSELVLLCKYSVCALQ